MNTYFDEKIVKTDRGEDKASQLSAGRIALMLLTVIASAGLIVGRSAVASAVVSACRICVKSLLPALFPFMVISEIFTRIFASDKAPLISAFLIGNLCGFPIGAKILSDLRDKGLINAEQYLRYFPLCSNPGLAFTVVGVGANLWNSYLIGIVLYSVTLLSGVLVSLMFAGKNTASIAPRTRIFAPRVQINDSSEGFGRVFVSAVTGSTAKMLNVCGFVVFFSAFTSIFCGIFESLDLPPLFSALFYSFFEISGATAALADPATLGLSADIRLALTFFAHGFGGLCIYAQILSVTKDNGQGEKYILFKLLQGILSALAVTIFCFPHIISTGGI